VTAPDRHRQDRWHRGWLPGFVVGLTAGLATLEIPTVGWLLVVAFAIPALIGRQRAAAIGGLLTGLGTIWLVLLGRVAIACPARSPNEPGCHAPDIGPWLAFGAAMFASGVLLSFGALLVARGRRR
jgi:hypothetical protein